MSHRLWWLIFSVALLIGVAIEFDLRLPVPQSEASVSTSPASIAAQRPAARRG